MRVATLERSIGASVERIFENVLDWEHLPWLHAHAFSAVRLLRRSREGWTARVRLRVPEGPAPEPVIEVAIDRGALRYTTRTASGPGEGTVITTALDPREEHVTAIRVTFDVPGVPAPAAPALGDFYLALYGRLWDEDEAMMRGRQEFLDGRGRPATPARLRIPAELRGPGPVRVELAGEPVRIDWIDGRPVAHIARCPHQGAPLAEEPAPGGVITCPWHGYRFDLRSGRSCDGRGLSLPGRLRVRPEPDGALLLVLDPPGTAHPPA